MEHQATAAQEILVALCLIGEGEKGRELFAFASPKEKEGLEGIAGRLCRRGEVDRKRLLERIARLRRLKSFSPLEELHPGWIVEKLEGESPRLLGLLCRFLTGDRIRFLIKHLEAPKVKETYQVQTEVAEIVRRLIEKKLAPTLPPLPGESFSFFDLVRTKTEDLRVLFWDLGLEEIRAAFNSVEPQVLRAFLARFTTKEAGEIRARIEKGGPVAPERRHEAQRHLVSLHLEASSTGGLLREVGFSVFARSLSPEDISWAGLVCQKLSPEEGYHLRRIVNESIFPPREPSQTVGSREAILGRFFALASRGLVRRYWKEEDEFEPTAKENAA